MAEQTAIGYEQTKEWQQFQTGGTRVDADDLNRMEGGIVDACDAVDQLRTKRLPTYVVAQDGDTATQDVYMEDILGPCLILDLATRTTYYETGGDEEGHRKAITSGADIDDLRDSLSQCLDSDGVQDLGGGLTLFRLGRLCMASYSVNGVIPNSYISIGNTDHAPAFPVYGAAVLDRGRLVVDNDGIIHFQPLEIPSSSSMWRASVTWIASQ